MPKISTKYYRRAKACTDLSINLIKFGNDFNNIEINNSIDNNTDNNIDNNTDNNINNNIDNNIDNSINNINIESYDSDNNKSDNNDLINETTLNNGELINNCKNSNNTANKSSLASQLATWALKNKITHVALNELLGILKSEHNDLPSDARVLMKTPRKKTVKIVEPGHYFHFGLNNCVQKLFSFVTLKNLRQVEVYINIDGLPLFKSSNQQLWPILCSLVENRSKVGIVGIYHGETKPIDANVFLKDFINEAIDLSIRGVTINESNYPFKIKGFICDTPAKAFIKFTKGHTGYYSCTKCVIEGDYINGRVCFSSLRKYPDRTDFEFRSKTQEEHHVNSKIPDLELIKDLNMINDFPVEPMHLIDLGVTRTLVHIWCIGKPPMKLSHTQISQISDLLINQVQNIPLEFNRKPRSLQESKRWKATEFRQFLLYTGPVVLKSVLSHDNYLNFMCLNVAVTILSSPNYYIKCFDYANSLFNYFVKSYIILYGKDNCSINIHNLLHVCDDVKKFGLLQDYSAYPFENYMQKIKGYIRKKDKPLQQIINRIYEENFVELNEENKLNTEPELLNMHNNGPLDRFLYTSQWEKIVFPNFILQIKEPDNCCKLNNGDIILIKNIVSIDSENTVIIGYKYESITDFYNEPCKSSDLNIHLVENIANNLQRWNINEISHKCVRLQFKDKFVVFPLLHSL